MKRWLWLARAVAAAGVALLMWWMTGATRADSREGQPPPDFRRLYPPGSCPNPCVHNSKNPYGYYATTWRPWPGEEHPEQDNPRSLNAEKIQTPQGREEVPAPKATPQLQPQPQQPLPPPTGQIVPPAGMLIPNKPPEETLGEPKPAAPSKPLPEEQLPGLPGEPERPAPGGKPSPTPSPTPSPSPSLSPPLTPSLGPLPGANGPSGPAPQDGGTRPTDPKAQDTPQWKPVSLIGSIEPERNCSPAGARRADSIDVAAPGSLADRVEPAGYTAIESSSPPVIDHAAMPREALGGYCPVELGSHGRWTAGDLRWTVVYKGWIYRLSGVQQWQQFQSDPDRFVPANSSNDPVLSVDENRTVPGQVANCALYNGRLYMFSNAATQAQFNQSPQRYAAGK